jgi:acyl-CoA synthetase (AMP-forming)/AMP-acid ligase II
VKIDDNGEVMFRSPGVFLGYYKDPEKTAETKTPDGWVKSGDAGFFDAKTGHLKIIDRAKDVGRLKDGTCSRRNTSRTSSNSIPTSRKPSPTATSAITSR